MINILKIRNRLLRKSIKETLSSYDEEILNDLFDDEMMGKMINEFKMQDDVKAFTEYMTFLEMFFLNYREPGAWDKNHRNWRQQYKDIQNGNRLI